MTDSPYWIWTTEASLEASLFFCCSCQQFYKRTKSFVHLASPAYPPLRLQTGAGSSMMSVWWWNTTILPERRIWMPTKSPKVNISICICPIRSAHHIKKKHNKTWKFITALVIWTLTAAASALSNLLQQNNGWCAGDTENKRAVCAQTSISLSAACVQLRLGARMCF